MMLSWRMLIGAEKSYSTAAVAISTATASPSPQPGRAAAAVLSIVCKSKFNACSETENYTNQNWIPSSAGDRREQKGTKQKFHQLRLSRATWPGAQFGCLLDERGGTKRDLCLPVVVGFQSRQKSLGVDGCLVVHLHMASSILVTDVNTHHCPKKCRIFGFCEGEPKGETSVLCLPVALSPLPSVTSMNLLRVAIIKRQPSFPPSDKTVIILHLHDKWVCRVRIYVCMYEC